MYNILKVMVNDGVKTRVVLLDSLAEVWEFESQSSADIMATILQKNSDSGHRYLVRKADEWGNVDNM